MSPAHLLQTADPAPFEVYNEGARSPYVIVCDHAGVAIPVRLGSLGLQASDLRRHIASDLGAAELGKLLAARLDAVLIMQAYSRLVIDCNRPPGRPDSVATISEHTVIAGNADLSDEDRRAREDEIFSPYHQRIREELDRRRAHASVLVALHSFTPVYKGVARVFHAGILYGRDARLATPMLAHLRREHDLVVGDNEPYAVSDETDYTVVVHGERRSTVHVELEVRQDLIADSAGRMAWCERLAAALEHGLPHALASGA